MDTPAQEQACTVLVNHRREALGACSCGWGLLPRDYWQTHSQHVLDMLTAAGLKVVTA